jgi:hypothetical protein
MGTGFLPPPVKGRTMRSPAIARLRHQADALRRQFLQDGGLPFAAVLTIAGIEEALREIKATWYDRIYTPLVTLRVFLGQVLNADQSCRAAVARLIADGPDELPPRRLRGRREPGDAPRPPRR